MIKPTQPAHVSAVKTCESYLAERAALTEKTTKASKVTACSAIWRCLKESYAVTRDTSNEKKMSDGHRERAWTEAKRLERC